LAAALPPSFVEPEMTNKASIFLISLFLCVAQNLPAQETSATAQRVSRDQINVWIEELANKDPKPFDEPYILKPPRNLNRASLIVVKNAYDNLAANVAKSLPALIESLEDKRYSYYQESPSGAFLCHTVGEACYSIIVRNIEVYRPYATVLDKTERPRTVHFIDATGGPQKWLASRKDKSLFDMQLEAVEWALRQKKPDPQELVSDADWKKAIDDLRDFHAGFRTKGKPVVEMIELWFEGK
jgi:hypothetical protein